MDVTQASSECEAVLETISEAVICERSFLEEIMVGVVGRGHVLLEDVPGTGKTLTAHSIASALGLSFSRIQFTPDLLPADVTGTHVFNERERQFEFNEGPIFANIVLADEINRAPPKTQAALLEAMEEGQVTTDGETRQLPDPFFVIATQNPVEQEGTFPLPEAQLIASSSRPRWAIPTRPARSNCCAAVRVAKPGARRLSRFSSLNRLHSFERSPNPSVSTRIFSSTSPNSPARRGLMAALMSGSRHVDPATVRGGSRLRGHARPGVRHAGRHQARRPAGACPPTRPHSRRNGQRSPEITRDRECPRVGTSADD